MQDVERDWRKLREARGISLSELARRTGINKGHVSMIETRRMVPHPHEARAILAALDKEDAA